MASGMRPEWREGASQGKTWVDLSSKGNGMCQGPAAGAYLGSSRARREASVARELWGWGSVRNVSREVARGGNTQGRHQRSWGGFAFAQRGMGSL